MIVCLIPNAQAADMDLTKAVIHHTATYDVPISVIRDYHVNVKGWDDVGYHFLIRSNGKVEKGRPLTKKGAHARTGKLYSRNNYIGIALTGHDEFTDKQKTSLFKLLARLGVQHIERHHGKCPGSGDWRLNDLLEDYPNIY